MNVGAWVIWARPGRERYVTSHSSVDSAEMQAEQLNTLALDERRGVYWVILGYPSYEIVSEGGMRAHHALRKAVRGFVEQAVMEHSAPMVD